MDSHPTNTPSRSTVSRLQRGTLVLRLLLVVAAGLTLLGLALAVPRSMSADPAASATTADSRPSLQPLALRLRSGQASNLQLPTSNLQPNAPQIPSLLLLADPIVNGGFEIGDLTGWSRSGSADNSEALRQTNFTPNIAPTEGISMALLCTGPGIVDETNTPQGNLDGDLNGYQAYDTSILSQILTLTARDVPATLSFDWSFLTAEGSRAPDPYDDFFRVKLGNDVILAGSKPGGSSPFPDVALTQPAAQVTSAGSNGSTNGCNFTQGRSAFGTFRYLITDPGTYTLEFLVADEGDNNVDSGLLIDNVQLTPEVDLAITKTASPAPAIAGEPLIYEITVTNNGTGRARSVIVTDTLPLEVEYITDTLATYITPTLPGGCTFSASSGPGGADQLFCYLGDITGGAARSFEVEVDVDADALANGALALVNTAEVDAETPDRNPENDVFILETILQDLADLQVTKVSKPDTQVRAGELFTYTIYVDNLGPSFARAITLTDDILAVGTFTVTRIILDPNRIDICTPMAPPPVGGGPGPTIIECELNEPLEPFGHPSGNGRWTIQVVVTADQTQDVNNEVRVSSTDDPQTGLPGTPDPDLSNNEAEDFISVTDVADLWMTKIGEDAGSDPDSDPYTVLAGETITWTIRVGNNGPSTAENVKVVDILPRGMVEGSVLPEAKKSSGDAGQCVLGTPGDPNEPLICQLGNLAPSETATVTIVADIDPSYVANQPNTPYANYLPNDAYLTSDTFDPDTDDNIAFDAFVEVMAQADLGVQKLDQPDPVRAGNPLNYTITISNTGPSTAEDTVLVDQLPPYLTFESATVINGVPGSTCTFSAGPRTVTCELGNVPPAPPTVTVLIDMLVNTDAPAGSITNRVDVTSATSDPDLTNSTNITATTTISTEADLDIIESVIDSPDPVVAGEQLTYHIHVLNHGPSLAPDPVVTSTFTFSPTGSGFVTYAGATELCTWVGPDQIRCDLQDDLAAGEEHYFDLFVDVAPAFKGVITNTATTSSAVLDPFLANNTFAQDTRVIDVADLRIAKIGDPDAIVVAGELLTYTITVDNIGPSDARNVVLTDTLDPRVTFAFAIPAQTSGPNPLVWNPLSSQLAAGGRITVTVVVTANANIGPPFDPLSDRVEVSSDAYDPDVTNNAATLFTDPTAFSDLEVSKAAAGEVANVPGPGVTLTPNQVTAGRSLTYTLTITNHGPSVAYNVELQDRLPPGIMVTSATPSQGSCDTGAPGEPLDKLICSLGPLAVEAGARVTITADVDPAIFGGTILENDAFVLSDNYDPNNGNNSATNLTIVNAVADLAIAKKDRPDPVIAGEQLEYTLEITNGGPSVARDVIVSDTLPADLTALDVYVVNEPHATCQIATTPANRIDCGLGDMAVGKVITIVITSLVDPSTLPDGKVITNTAVVFSPTPDPDTSNNAAPQVTTIHTQADVEIEKTSEPVKVFAGEQKKYHIKVTNNGPSDAQDVVVYDVLPDEVYKEIDTNTPNCTQPQELVGFRAVLSGTTSATGLATFVLNTETNQLLYAIEVSDIDDIATAQLGNGFTTSLYDGPPPEFDPTHPFVGSVVLGDTEESQLLNNTNTFEVDVESMAEIQISGMLTQTINTPLRCEMDTMAPHESREFDIWTRVRPEARPNTIIRNVAIVTSTTTLGDPVMFNNVAHSKNLVLQKADLKITKFGKPDLEVRAGEILTYTVIVDNLGPSYAGIDGRAPVTGNVALKDILQSSLEFDLIDITTDRDAFCVGVPGPAAQVVTATLWPPPPAPPPFEVLPPTGVDNINQRLELDCALLDALEVLEADGPPNSGRWILTMRVRAPETQDINNIAHAVSDAFDPDPSNNQAEVLHEITDVSDLEVTKTEVGEVQVDGQPGGTVTLEDNEVTAGRSLTYTLVITNYGPSTAENVVLQDRLPPWIVVTGYTASQGACDTGTPGEPLDKLTCGLGTLAPAPAAGSSATITITADVPSWVPEGAILENDALTYSDIFDPTNANNFATNLTTVNARADLAITKTDNPDPVVAGELLNYTVVVTNIGPSDARNVVVVDILPNVTLNDPLVTYISDTDACYQDPIDRAKLTCSLRYIPAGESRSFDILVLVNTDVVARGYTSITNSVAVSSDTIDPYLVNNSDTETTAVNEEADIYIAKTDIPDPVVAGTQMRYRVTFGNRGPSVARTVTVTDTLPAKIVFNRCEPVDPDDEVLCSVISGAYPNPQTIRLNSLKTRGVEQMGNLDVGEEHSFYIVVDVSSSYVLDKGIFDPLHPLANPNNPARNTALIASATPDTRHPEDNQDTELTYVLAEADLEVSKTDTPDPSLPDAYLTYDPVSNSFVFTYTITIRNNGPSDAAVVLFEDALPADTEFITWTIPINMQCVFRDDGTVICLVGNGPNNAGTNQRGRLNVTSEISFTIRARVDADSTPRTLVNRAEVQAVSEADARVYFTTVATYLPGTTPTADPDLSNNVYVETTTVVNAEVRVDKKAVVGRDLTAEGLTHAEIDEVCRTEGVDDFLTLPPAQVTYCYFVYNEGDTWLTNVEVTDAHSANIVETLAGPFVRIIGRVDTPPSEFNTAHAYWATNEGHVAPLAPAGEVHPDGYTYLLAVRAVTLDFADGGTEKLGSNTATVTAVPTTKYSTVLPGVLPVSDTDSLHDTLTLPVLEETIKDWDVYQDDGDGLPSPGDVIEYTVDIPNAGIIEATGVEFYDGLYNWIADNADDLRVPGLLINGSVSAAIHVTGREPITGREIDADVAPPDLALGESLLLRTYAPAVGGGYLELTYPSAIVLAEEIIKGNNDGDDEVKVATRLPIPPQGWLLRFDGVTYDSPIPVTFSLRVKYQVRIKETKYVRLGTIVLNHGWVS